MLALVDTGKCQFDPDRLFYGGAAAAIAVIGHYEPLNELPSF